MDTRPPLHTLLSNRLALIGELAVGKDTLAARLGFRSVGFADPIYAVLGTNDKTLPGAREAMQRIGQWGRGIVSPAYPLSVERRLWEVFFKDWIGYRQEFGLRAEEYGTPDFWAAGYFRRPFPSGPLKVALTNVRFENELELAEINGWPIVLVVCSDSEELERRQLKACGGDLNRTTDVSEKFSREMSRHVAFAYHPGGKQSEEILNRSGITAVVDTATKPWPKVAGKRHVSDRCRIPYYNISEIPA